MCAKPACGPAVRKIHQYTVAEAAHELDVHELSQMIHLQQQAS